jgi:hypothetical protein
MVSRDEERRSKKKGQSIRWLGGDQRVRDYVFEHGDNQSQEFYETEATDRHLAFGVLRVHHETCWQPYVSLKTGERPFYFLWNREGPPEQRPLYGLTTVAEMLPALVELVQARTNDEILALMV